jgi:hypothetical protein
VIEERHGFRGGPGVSPGPPSIRGLRGPFEAPFPNETGHFGAPHVMTK